MLEEENLVMLWRSPRLGRSALRKPDQAAVNHIISCTCIRLHRRGPFFYHVQKKSQMVPRWYDKELSTLEIQSIQKQLPFQNQNLFGHIECR